MKNLTAFRILIPLLLCLICVGLKEAQSQTTVNFATSLGDIEIQLFDTDRPVSVANFLGYVQRGDYDGTIFHRTQSAATQGIGIVQGGGFLTDLTAITRLAPIVNEAANDPNPLNTVGTIAYARSSQLNSATSEFFFNTVNNPNLDSQTFTVFGEVTSGIEVVNMIQALDTTQASGDINFNDLPVIDINATPVEAAGNLAVLSRATVVASVPEPTAAVVLTLGGTIGLTRRRRRQLS